ncbi:MAG: aldehyde dehydrogenase family protein [Thermoanaerobaculia bacterium]
MAAEEWIAGPGIAARNLRLLERTWREIADHGAPRIPRASLRRRRGGQLVVQVLPDDAWDRLAWAGSRAEVWMEPEEGRPEPPATLLGAGREPPPPGVALVLGAGNVNSIPLLDAVWKLFAELRVVLLKLNPVNDYLEPHFARLFRPLLDDGFLRLARGGGETGAFLTAHPLVDSVHITGSVETHDRIVWGTGDEAARRRAEGRPQLTKPITSELGNVSPVIVVPGEWSDSEITFAAENLATQMVQNGGFNCNAAKVLVTSERWPQRRALLDELARVLAALPPRPAYYPGAEERWERFTEGRQGLKTLGERRPGVVPPALIEGVDHRVAQDPLFRQESFCAVTAEVLLPEGDPAGFLFEAARFANDTLFGTLNAGIFVDPRTRRRLGHNLEEAVADLNYGSVAVNHWAAVSFGLGATPWGAFPGHTLADAGSGIGWVHNTRLLARPQKSVVYGPFVPRPKPPWLVTHANALTASRRYFAFEAAPSPLRLAALALAAARG